MTDHKVLSREKWAAAREELLALEKEHTRLGDELARRRRELPWVRVEKEYRFETDSKWVEPMIGQLPPVAARNATDTGTDLVHYMTQGFGFSAFVLDEGVVYQTYSTGGRGVEFLMGYYGVLDRAPKGRDEG